MKVHESAPQALVFYIDKGAQEGAKANQRRHNPKDRQDMQSSR